MNVNIVQNRLTTVTLYGFGIATSFYKNWIIFAFILNRKHLNSRKLTSALLVMMNPNINRIPKS